MSIGKVRKDAPNTVEAARQPAHPAVDSDAEMILCVLMALRKGAHLIYSSGNRIERFAAVGKQKLPIAPPSI